MTAVPLDLPEKPSRFRRGMLWLSLVFIGVFTAAAVLVMVWYARENAQGEREWAETQRDLAARGESLDLAHFIPPPVPDEQNLAMAPLFVWLYRYHVDPATGLLTFGEQTSDGSTFVGSFGFGKDDSRRPRPLISPGWRSGHPTDLATFQRYYSARDDFPHAPTRQSPAEDILLALTRFAPTLDEITHEAAERPHTRMPLNWAQRPAAAIKMPHYTFFRGVVKTLQLRASAELAADRTDDARRDVILGLRLVQDLRDEPLLISHLVAMSCTLSQMEPIWNGLAGRRWSAVQLAEIQARLQVIDLLDGYQRAVRMERALFFVPMVEQMHTPNGFEHFYVQNVRNGYVPPWYVTPLVKQVPRGWGEKSVAIICRKTQTYLIDAVHVSERRIDVRRLESLYADPAISGSVIYNALARISLPLCVVVGKRTALAQTYLDEAATACALERFYVDHQAYPDALAALVPTYLSRVPGDVISGSPLRYERTPDGRYQLWAVGWDGQDDGGRVAWKKDARSPALDDENGDWVWQYEPLSPP